MELALTFCCLLAVLPKQEVWSAKEQYCQGLPANSINGTGGNTTQRTEPGSAVEAFGGSGGGRK